MNIPKSKQLIIYILNEVGSHFKFNEDFLIKLVFQCESCYYEMYRKDLTGLLSIDEVNDESIPYYIVKAIGELVSDKEIQICNSAMDTFKKKYIPSNRANLGIFTAREIKVIDVVLSNFVNNLYGIKNYNMMQI